MSARVVDVAENLVTIRVVGQLQHTELKEVQSAVGELIQIGRASCRERVYCEV